MHQKVKSRKHVSVYLAAQVIKYYLKRPQLQLVLFSDRKIVLRHHPDKRQNGGENVYLDCDYFSCITKAYEILSDPLKRRSYDSVDDIFDDTVPNSTTYNKNHFFEVFPSVFEKNSM